MSVTNSRRAANEEGEQQDDACLADQEGDADQRHHHPPGEDALVEVLDDQAERPFAPPLGDPMARPGLGDQYRAETPRNNRTASWGMLIDRAPPA